MKINIKALQVKHGDAIVIEIEQPDHETFRILVDGGPSGMIAQTTNPALKGHRASGLTQQLDSYRDKGLTFDIVFLTHIDADHIGGLLAAYTREEYRHVLGKNIYFNSARLIAAELKKIQPADSDVSIPLLAGPETSVKQAIKFDDLLDALQAERKLLKAGDELTFQWGTIHILSPTLTQLRDLLDKWVKETPPSETSSKKSDYAETIQSFQDNDIFVSDTSVTNASSLAFLLESPAGTALLLGDALSSTVCDSLRRLGCSETDRLEVDVCKVSHHGSAGNTCNELLSLVRVKDFLISANGAKQLPNKQTLARILKHSPESRIIFNHPDLASKIFSCDELESWQNISSDSIDLIIRK